eukprot:TRINITY_DN15434_c0_g1_i2.p1 TRINITY_DN15434_c0_g1~~TRINITY_DN15434_c0_g1_i2.p1  ORF type:complete len:803 (-),score=192.08 TRINITY_DN15434_c0_g1_i2:166-2574(-)
MSRDPSDPGAGTHPSLTSRRRRILGSGESDPIPVQRQNKNDHPFEDSFADNDEPEMSQIEENYSSPLSTSPYSFPVPLPPTLGRPYDVESAKMLKRPLPDQRAFSPIPSSDSPDSPTPCLLPLPRHPVPSGLWTIATPREHNALAYASPARPTTAPDPQGPFLVPPLNIPASAPAVLASHGIEDDSAHTQHPTPRRRVRKPSPRSSAPLVVHAATPAKALTYSPEQQEDMEALSSSPVQYGSSPLAPPTASHYPVVPSPAPARTPATMTTPAPMLSSAAPHFRHSFTAPQPMQKLTPSPREDTSSPTPSPAPTNPPPSPSPVKKRRGSSLSGSRPPNTTSRATSTSSSSPTTPRFPVNINPFTPEGRTHIDFDTPYFNPDLEDKRIVSGQVPPSNIPVEQVEPPPPASHDFSSLYRSQFQELELIGKGTYGHVFKCRHKLDGCLYAIKRTIRALKGNRDRQIVLREVYGLAAIVDYSHILRYYNAWEEDGRLHIQTEICYGGNLQQAMERYGHMGEHPLLVLLKQLASGLAHIHSLGLVHLDIKPENVYIKEPLVPSEMDSATTTSSSSSSSSTTTSYTSSEEAPVRTPPDAEMATTPRSFGFHDLASTPVYKIGDLGLLDASNTTKVYMEGDSRYLSRELLQDDMDHLTACDIFALGATLYELCRGKVLPSHGDEWISIRDGKLRRPNTALSDELWVLMCSLMHPDPLARPSASAILAHPLVKSIGDAPSYASARVEHEPYTTREMALIAQIQSLQAQLAARTEIPLAAPAPAAPSAPLEVRLHHMAISPSQSPPLSRRGR